MDKSPSKFLCISIASDTGENWDANFMAQVGDEEDLAETIEDEEDGCGASRQ